MGIGSGTLLNSPEPKPTSNRIVWTIVIILLLVLLLGGGYLLTRKQPKSVEKAQTPVAPAVVPTPPPPPEPIKDTIHFAFDKSTLSPGEQANVKAFWEKVNGKTGQITIGGYTCNMGTDWHNQWLSERRADRVAKLLAAPDGYAVKVEAYGKTKPVADNSTKEGREANRRAEVVFTPAP